MGWFRRAFSRPRTFAPDAFPFSGEVRMHHEEYDLGTGWWKVSVSSAEEWEAKLAEMRQGIRNHYGRYVTKDGRAVPRWNDETWERFKTGLVVERR